MSNEIFFRAANDADRESVISLLNNVFNEQERSTKIRDHMYWFWKFKESPFGPSILTVGVCKGEIITVDNLWPWEFSYKGEVIKAIQPCDTAVYPDFRGKGLFKKMREFGLNEAERQSCSLAFNFPNKNSLPGNRSLGADYLGRITWWVKVLKPINLLKNKIFKSEEKQFLLPEKYKLNTETIDELSSKVNESNDSITIHRVPGFHKWRYADHPSRTYGMINICEDNKQTVVIFTVNTKGGTREMVVVDLIGDKGQKEKIIEAIARTGRRLEADFIAVMQNHQFGIEHLWKYGFIKKKLKNMVVTPINPNLSVDVSSIKNWSMLAGMHDSI